jgi:hypothetical protein
MVKSRGDYEDDIRKFHADILADPKSEKLRKQLSNRLSRWASMLDIAVRVASNEQKPWTEVELGILTIPMAKKSENGFDQVGDYQFEILGANQEVIPGGHVIERKEVSDLYNTLMNQNKRGRFKREVDRYKADPRFDLMTIMVEGSITDFVNYVPEIYVFRWDQVPGTGVAKLAEYLKRYYKIEGVTSENTCKYAAGEGSEISIDTGAHLIRLHLRYSNTVGLYIDRTLRDTLVIKKLYGKPAVYQAKGASDESKIATIAKLFTKRTPVSWCDSRENAIKLYRQLIRQWCIENYDKILKL